jgi:hypothetical protein
LGALEELVRIGFVHLIVPQIVRDEFARNRDRVIEESSRSIAGTLRRAKEMVAKFGDEKAKGAVLEQLNEIDQKSVNYRDAAKEAVERIEKLFGEAEVVKTTKDVKLRAAERALAQKAPFHRQRNGMGDSVLIEAYADIQKRTGGPYAFVTHNTKDFSAVGADDRLPHPDIGTLFSKQKSRYFTRLGDALNAFRPEEFQDVVIEQTWDVPPRRYAEIFQAIDKLIDQVWYNRHQVWNEKLASGDVKLIPDNEERGRDPLGVRINEGVWKRAEAAVRAKEKQYGVEALGPWDNFEWGMINGKLSALRWVLGDDWDMLDT